MSKAVLTIAVEGGADARRAFGQIGDAARRAQQGIRNESERTKRSVYRDLDDETKAAIRAAHAREQTDSKLAAVRVRLSAQAADTVARQVALGVTTEKNAATEKERIYRNLASAYIREEQRMTTAAQSGAGRRASFGQRARAGASQAGGMAGRVLNVTDRVFGAAGELARMAGGGQERYAGIESTLNHALYQASPDNNEIRQRRGELLSYARANNLDFEDVAGAASAAQERFSALGNRSDSRQTRDARMADFLGQLTEARNLGVDSTQFTQLAGALQQGGITGTTQRDALRSLAGISMRGGVELGDLVGQGLRPMMAAIARAQPGGPAAVQAAIAQTASAMEVLAPRGLTALGSGNALGAITQTLGNDRTQQSLLAHVRNRFGHDSDLERQLFENGRLKADQRDALTFGETISTAFHGDRDAVANFLGTEQDRHGHVLRQTMTAPMRNAIAALSQSTDGKSGFQQIRDIQAGATMGEREVMQGGQLFGNQTEARLTASKNESMLALLSSPVANAAANAQRDFEAAHPFLNAIAGMIPGGESIRGGFLAGQTAVNASRTEAQGPALAQLGPNGLPVSLSQVSIRQLTEAMSQVNVQAHAPDPHDAAFAATRGASNPAGSQGH